MFELAKQRQQFITIEMKTFKTLSSLYGAFLPINKLERMTLLRTLDSIDLLVIYLTHGIAVVHLVESCSKLLVFFLLHQKSNGIYEAIFVGSLNIERAILAMEWNMFIALLKSIAFQVILSQKVT